MAQIFLLGTSFGFGLYMLFSLLGFALRSSMDLFKIK